MLHVVRRAQLIFPQLNILNNKIFICKCRLYLLHIQSSGEKSPPLFSAAFFPIELKPFDFESCCRLPDAK